MKAEMMSVISQILSLILAVTCLWISQCIVLKKDWGIGRIIILTFVSYGIIRALLIILVGI